MRVSILRPSAFSFTVSHRLALGAQPRPVGGVIGILMVLGSLMVLGGLAGCGRDSTAVVKAATQVVMQNFDAAAKGDLDAYRDTLHKSVLEGREGPVMMARMQRIFNHYKLSYRFVEPPTLVGKAHPRRVELAFVLETRRVSGPEFHDNRTTGHFVVVRDGETWRISSTKIKEIQYLRPGEAAPPAP